MFFKNFLVVDTDNLVSTFLNPIFVRTVELLFTKVKKRCTRRLGGLAKTKLVKCYFLYIYRTSHQEEISHVAQRLNNSCDQLEFVLKVFQMAMNADQKLKCEALWTLCNAIETLEPANLLTFVSKYNE